LSGFSPYNVLRDTKSDLGPNPCPVQETALCQEWQQLPQEEKDKYGFEYDLKTHLEQLVSEHDRKIHKTKERIESSNPVSLLCAEEASKVTELLSSIAELQKKSQELGEDGDIDGSLALHQQAEQLRVQKDDIERAAAPANEKRQFVCEVSGLIYSSTDNEARIRDLQAGRSYQGWKQIRDRLVQLRAMNPPKGDPGYNRAKPREQREEKRHRSRSRSPRKESSRSRGHHDRRDRHREDHRDSRRDRRSRSRERRR